MTTGERFQVVKVGRAGWSIHSEHDSREEAEFEALRCNTFSDAQFSVWEESALKRLFKATSPVSPVAT